jgi:phage terminase small subunit
VAETLKKKELREQLFAREYLLDLNGTRAAIAVGYSPKRAAQAASRMLRRVKVRALLAQLLGRLGFGGNAAH